MTAPLEMPEGEQLAPLTGGTWTTVAGAVAGVAAGGIKPGTQRDDVVVLSVEGDETAVAAGVSTRSTAAAAPARWTRDRLPGRARAIVINAGNANAATGPRGERDVLDTARAAAEILGCAPEEVLVASTGVIGVPLPMDRLLPAVARAAGDLSAPGEAAARAILTTDLVDKQCAYSLDGVTCGGVAKGSGMIHPNMATMLGFLATDARVSPADLQALVSAICDRTFNAITVDGDTSTNDALVVLATGRGRTAAPGSPAWGALAATLEACCAHLARAIAADGEGATTLLEVVVQGCADDAAARAAARAIARSPLVKSAVHGRDPNWGRIVGALGAAEVPGLETLDLDLAGVPVLRAGVPLPFDEAVASAALTAPEVRITARLEGPGYGRAWGCDLTAQYVAINADYRS